MKNKNLNWLIVVFIALLVFSCEDSIDNIERQNSSTFGAIENPLSDKILTNGGEQNWSLIRSIDLTVLVNDDYEGKYYSLVTVYDSNPLSAKLVPNVLVSGRAKSEENFKIRFSVPSSLKQLFIEQKAPNGSKSLMVYTLEPGVKLVTATAAFKKAVQSRVKSLSNLVASTKAYPIETDVNPVVYESIPSDAIELGNHKLETWDSFLEANKNYKVTGDYDELDDYWSTSNTFIYVSGTWNLTTARIKSFAAGITVVIMPGGVIKAKDLNLIGTASISIMEGGLLEVTDDFSFANLNHVYNLGTMKIEKLKDNPGLIYNGVNAEAIIADLCVLSLPGQASVINYGSLKTINIRIGSSNYLYSSGVIEVAEELNLRDAVVFIDGGKVKSEGLISFNGKTATLKNGAIIKSTTIIKTGSLQLFHGVGDDNLLIAPEIIFGWPTSVSAVVYKGLVLASDDFQYPANNLDALNFEDTNVILCSIVDCTIDPDNGGNSNDPVNQNPNQIINNTIYSYAFEDNWPKYGDYDMNDAVVYLNQTKKVIDNNNKVTSFVVKGTVMALGASKTIKLFLRLTAVKSATINEVTGATIDIDKTILYLGKFSELLGSEEHKITNTWSDGTAAVSPGRFEVTYTFVNSVEQSDLDIASLDIFIVTSEGIEENRTEVHLPNFPPTERANCSQLGTANSLSQTQPYLSKSVDNEGHIIEDGLCFALMIPVKYYWSVELQKINETYYHFGDWVKSNGQEYTDWYNYLLDEYANVNLIYPVDELPETE